MTWTVTIEKIEKYENRIEMDVLLAESESGMTDRFHYVLNRNENLDTFKRHMRKKI